MTLLVFHDDIFPQNLKHLRKKEHLTQKALALRTGINIFWIRGIESGRYHAEMPASDYWKLCNALKVTPGLMVSRYLP